MTRRFLHGASWGQCCQLFLRAVAVVALGLQHASVAATFDFDGLPMTVPDGFLIERIAAPPLVERPVSIDFDEQGRLYVSESSGSNAKLVEQQTDPRHRILRLEDSDGDGIFDRRTVFADRLMMLQGTLWHQGSLYVSAAPEILRLTDTDGDGVADERTVWHDGKTLTGCGNDLHGPALGRDGRFYFTKGAFAEQTHDLIGQPGWTSRASHIFRARPDGGDLEVVLTGGMDNPVDVAFTSAGERLLSATFLQRPADGRRDGVVHAIYGGVYGKEHGVLAGHARTGDLMPVLVHLSAAAACGLHVHSGYGLGEEFRDNAFVCSFNLRGVSRHTLSPEAASFATRNEPFLTADSADFHPTDVIEDADGSLVIVDTGGWYKLCCPTSQFEKPTVLGGIYRIRRANPANVTDATDHRGRRIDWATLDAENLAQLLADPRPAVVKQATERLARLGPAAIDPIASLLSSANRDARQAALWTLARFDDDASRAAARRGLVDPDPTVRHVAAHVAAIFRDEDAVAMLSEMVTRDTAEVARAAAEALGRIGGEQAVAALLAACPRAGDRCLEHSVIYGLIEAGRPTQVLAAINAESPRVRRATLVALDQMPLRHPHLTAPDPERLRQEIQAACRDDDAALRDAGFWLLSEHPEWADGLADGIVEILTRVAEARLATPPRTEEADRLSGRLARIALAPAIASALAAACDPGKAASGPANSDQSPPAVRLVALEVMEGARANHVPDAWVDALGRLLRHAVQTARRAEQGGGGQRAAGAADDGMPSYVLRTLAGMSLSAEQRRKLQPELLAIAAKPSQVPAMVTLALRAAGPEAALPEAVIARLIAMLAVPGADSADTISPIDRSAAAAAIATADLSATDLEAVAATFTKLPSSDVATLLPVITARGGLPLVHAIGALTRSRYPDRIPRELLAAAVSALPADEASRGPELLARVDAARAAERAAYTRLLARLPTGDPTRGHAVFLSQKAACTTCHAMGYAGGRVGPDLTKIGGVRTPADLLEAIVLPSASFVRSYEPVVVLTDDGRSFAGIIREETAAEVMLQTSATATERIRRAAIESLQAGTVSLMPKGYDTLLTPQEVADLVAFLARAK